MPEAKYTQLLTEEELKLLFPNQIQRAIFLKLMNQLIEVINERTILCSVQTY